MSPPPATRRFHIRVLAASTTTVELYDDRVYTYCNPKSVPLPCFSHRDRSMLKMLLDPMGGIVITNDGNCILREVGCEHDAVPPTEWTNVVG